MKRELIEEAESWDLEPKTGKSVVDGYLCGGDKKGGHDDQDKKVVASVLIRKKASRPWDRSLIQEVRCKKVWKHGCRMPTKRGGGEVKSKDVPWRVKSRRVVESVFCFGSAPRLVGRNGRPSCRSLSLRRRCLTMCSVRP